MYACGSRTPSEEGWADISFPLKSGMVHWPEDPPVRIERMLDMERGDVANVSTISRTGTTNSSGASHWRACGAMPEKSRPTPPSSRSRQS